MLLEAISTKHGDSNPMPLPFKRHNWGGLGGGQVNPSMYHPAMRQDLVSPATADASRAPMCHCLLIPLIENEQCIRLSCQFDT